MADIRTCRERRTPAQAMPETRCAGLIEGQKAGGPVSPCRSDLRRQAEQQGGQRPEPRGEPQGVGRTVAFISRCGLAVAGSEDYPRAAGSAVRRIISTTLRTRCGASGAVRSARSASANSSATTRRTAPPRSFLVVVPSMLLHSDQARALSRWTGKCGRREGVVIAQVVEKGLRLFFRVRAWGRLLCSHTLSPAKPALGVAIGGGHAAVRVGVSEVGVRSAPHPAASQRPPLRGG